MLKSLLIPFLIFSSGTVRQAPTEDGRETLQTIFDNQQDYLSIILKETATFNFIFNQYYYDLFFYSYSNLDFGVSYQVEIEADVIDMRGEREEYREKFDLFGVSQYGNVYFRTRDNLYIYFTHIEGGGPTEQSDLENPSSIFTFYFNDLPFERQAARDIAGGFFILGINTTDIYDNGYDNGYDKGYDDGFDEGLNETQQEAFEEGYRQGQSSLDASFYLKSILSSIEGVMKVQILPNITIATVVFIPLILLLVKFILGWFR